jgi:hypothetical protein
VEHHIIPAEESAEELIAGLLSFTRLADVKKYTNEMIDMGIKFPQSTIENLKHAFVKADKRHTYEEITRRMKRR